MQALKRELTVRAKENVLGMRPPAFKVYREKPDGTLQIPRFFKKENSDVKFHRGQYADITFSGGTLRPYQADAVRAFQGNGILCLPCGAGKTSTSLAIAAKLKRKTLIIVHKEFLANQWRERITQFCPKSSNVGLIQGDVWDVEGHDFVIAMIQTLCVREHDPEMFKIFGLVIVDEAHHIGAPAFSKAMFKITPEFTLGLTATPERKDGLTMILYWFLGDIFYSMQQNVSDAITLHKIDFDHHSYRMGPMMNKFGKISLAHIVNHIVELKERNDLIIKHVLECVSRGRKILLLSDRRSHCEYLYSIIGESVAGLYMGGMSAEEHEQASRKQVIIATFSLAYEGLDIPSLNTLFLVTPHSDVKQAVGRITRNPGKTGGEIYDFVDKWCILPNMFYRRRKTIFSSSTENESSGCMFSADSIREC